MSRPLDAGRGRRKDTVLWGLSGALVFAAVVICAATSVSSRGPRPRRADVIGGAAPARSTGPSSASVPLVAENSRPLVFRERLTTLRPLQAALVRAFLPPAPTPSAARPLRVARVVPARTPQACLAQAVYYEARGEPAEGQAAVAQVVVNRTRSGGHPSDVCGAVFEGAARPGCQFSFACDPRLGRRALEPAAWRRAQGVADEVLAGRGPSGLQTALNYHADSVRPRWATQLRRTAEIGRHVFYASASAAGRALAGWSFTAPAPPPSGA